MQKDAEAKQTARVRERWDRAVAAVISATRRDLDVTQQQLAEKIGWTRDAVANAERNRRNIRVSDLIMIARALRMEPEALLRRIVRWQV